jgi:hypothetical protein
MILAGAMRFRTLAFHNTHAAPSASSLLTPVHGELQIPEQFLRVAMCGAQSGRDSFPHRPPPVVDWPVTGCARFVVAESVLARHQLLMLNP